MAPAALRPVRLAIVNDYEIVVAGIARMLADHGDRVVVVEQASRLPVLSNVDIILCDDFAKVVGDGVDLTELAQNGAKLVVFTWPANPEYVNGARTPGVAGYLSKSLTAVELVEALEAIRDDDHEIRFTGHPGMANGHGDWPGRAVGLTHREAEALALIAKGLSNQEIADLCYLSINSVKTYIRSAYRKVGVSRRAQAVRWALEHGFAPEATRVLTATEPGARH